MRGQPANKDLAKSIVDSIKFCFDRYPLSDLLSVDPEGWRDGMKRVLPHAQTFLTLVSDFTADYTTAKSAERALDFADLERLVCIDRERGSQFVWMWIEPLGLLLIDRADSEAHDFFRFLWRDLCRVGAVRRLGHE